MRCACCLPLRVRPHTRGVPQARVGQILWSMTSAWFVGLWNHTGFCARAVGCSCPWGALARYPSVPAPCPCPLPFGARPMPVPATLRCPPNYSFLGVLLLVGYPYPLCAPTRALSAPARCSCPWGARARYPSFSARPMPAPFFGRYSFATRSRCVLLLAQLLVPRRAPTRRLPLPALCSYPFATRARPMPVPSHCPCPRRARAPTPPFARSRSCACATTRPRARAMARGPRAATF